MPRVRDNPWLMQEIHAEADDFLKKLSKKHRLEEEEICRRVISVLTMLAPYFEKAPEQKEI